MDKPRWRHDVVGVDDTGDHDEAKANEDRRFCSSACFGSLVDDNGPVSYTHLTLPTNREV